MSELRKDPITGRWVIVAPDRMRRPNDFRDGPGAGSTLCPFCPGHEDLTPPEIAALRQGGRRDGPDWTLRVVPNRFPALRVEDDGRTIDNGLLELKSGLGAHEVVIETPRHDADLGDLTVAEVESVLHMWGDRLRDLAQDVRLQVGIVFRNHGEAAGATLAHPHSQIVVLPTIPDSQAQEIERGLRHFQENGTCLSCGLVTQERREGARIVLENERALALTPWAARAPFETWILPIRHASRFEHESPETLASVAAILLETLQRLAVALERPAYNLLLRTAPMREDELPHSHWRLEILPALTRPAGFEWGTGCFINPVPPEEAAAFLRKTKS